MASDPNVANLVIHVGASEELDAEGLDHLTRQLRDELRELDLESVELAPGEMPPRGVKSPEAFTLGALAVGILPSLIPKLIDFLQAWSLRGQNRVVKIKANIGDRSVEVEYAPGATSEAAVKGLVETLTGALVGKPAGSKSAA